MNNPQDELLYYQRELNRLRKEGKAFAEKYPGHGTHLRLDDPNEFDPLVERLLEGVAYLSGSLRKNIVEFKEEFFQELLCQLDNSHILPTPSMTVFTFDLPKHYYSSEITLPAGSLIKINQQEKSFLYTSLSTLNFIPIKLESVSLPVENILRLTLSTQQPQLIQKIENPLKIFFNGDKFALKKLFYFLSNYVEKVSVIFPEIDEEITLDNNVIHMSHLALDYSNPESSRQNFLRDLIRDYIHFPQRFGFFEIHGLRDIQWANSMEKFHIQIHFKKNLEITIPWDENPFHLHCVPAVNLFKTTAEPVIENNGSAHYNLRGDAQQESDTKMYSIKEVTAINLRNGKRTPLLPSFSQEIQNQPTYSYSINTQSDWPGYRLITHGLAKESDYALSVEILATQGNASRQISVGTKAYPVSHDVSLIGKLLMRPTEVLQSLSKDFNMNSYSDYMLPLHCLTPEQWLARIKYYSGKTPSIFQKIVDISMEAKYFIHKGISSQGLTVLISLKIGEAYLLEEIFLLGKVLHSSFVDALGFDKTLETRIKIQDSVEEFRWIESPENKIEII